MYRAPIRELRFVLDELLQSAALAQYRGFSDYSSDVAEAILGEAARFAETILDPINRSGDEQGARWTPEGVVTAPGFRAAYRQFAEGGWSQLGTDPAYGGQAVPQVLVTAVQEIWASANLAFKSSISFRYLSIKASVSTTSFFCAFSCTFLIRCALAWKG